MIDQEGVRVKASVDFDVQLLSGFLKNLVFMIILTEQVVHLFNRVRLFYIFSINGFVFLSLVRSLRVQQQCQIWQIGAYSSNRINTWELVIFRSYQIGAP
jgi:hypothetical protein